MNFVKTSHSSSPYRLAALGCFAVILLAVAPAHADTTWDSQALTTNGNPAGHGTQWWFDPYNWSGDNPSTPPPTLYLPPTKDGTTVTPAVISADTSTLPGSQGVVYYPQQQDGGHPDGDPNFSAASTYTYPTIGSITYGPQKIDALYVARNSTAYSLLTIKGDLTIASTGSTGFRDGFSGSTPGALNEGKIVQLAGTVSVPTTNLDIGSWESSGWGNGVYDYVAGKLDVFGNNTNHAIRLAHGSSGSGTGGIGRFIMNNPGPASPGYVRTYNYTVASDRTNGDGITRGVGITEFHYQNGDVRPIQIINNLSLNNGLDDPAFSTSRRSSRLSLILDAAPTVDINGVPQNLGLFDVDSLNVGGAIGGTGDLDGDGVYNNDRILSSADGKKDYYERSAWTRTSLASRNPNDFLVEATYGGNVYRWEVLYDGNITWSSMDDSTVASIDVTPGSGKDIVLKGVSSGPATSLAGDYSANGYGDAADFVTWRKNVRTSNSLANDPIGPLIDDSQYRQWRANFGKTPTSPGSSLAEAAMVPEPCTAALILVSIIGVSVVRRRS